jgi:hypothetical protein
MTRARTHIHIVTCFRPEDLDENRLSFGAVDFFELLDRELAGHSLLGTPATRALDSERETGEDPLVADLADRLRARGARVWHHYDGALDMAAAPDPIQLLGREEHEIPVPVAVESDGTAKYQHMSVRERSRLRPEMLERLGWRYVPLWTIEVFTDPSSCADQIGRYLGVASTAGDVDLSSLMGTSLDTSMTAVIDSPRSRRRNNGADNAQGPAGNADGSAGNADGQAGRVRSKESAAPTETAPEDAAPQATPDAAPDAAPQETEVVEGSDAPMSDADQPGNGGEAPSNAASQQAAKPAAPSKDADLLPKVAPNDAAHTWGDAPADLGHDAWLRENKPPHWG